MCADMRTCGLASHRSGYRSHRVGRQTSRFVNLQRAAFIGEVPCLLDKLRAAGLTSFLINGNHQGRESERERRLQFSPRARGAAAHAWVASCATHAVESRRCRNWVIR